MSIVSVNKACMSGEKNSDWLLLIIALSIMLLIVAYPPVFINALGRVQYAPLLLLLCAMSAGFVRGIGFIPRQLLVRLVLSRMACYFTLATFIEIFFIHRLANY